MLLGLLALFLIEVFEFLLCTHLRRVLFFGFGWVWYVFALSGVLLAFLDLQSDPSLPLIEPLSAHDMVNLIVSFWHEVDLHLLQQRLHVFSLLLCCWSLPWITEAALRRGVVVLETQDHHFKYFRPVGFEVYPGSFLALYLHA